MIFETKKGMEAEKEFLHINNQTQLPKEEDVDFPKGITASFADRLN